MMLFLDSGSYSLLTKSRKYAAKNAEHGKFGYYETDEFWEYMATYVKFIKKYESYIDLYANVDVIGSPELTWRNQKYLEDRGIKPVPVFHQGSKYTWLEKYIKLGYDLIALGGMVSAGARGQVRTWLKESFAIVCSNSDGMPRVKVHGFGVTGFRNMVDFPWWSVDSATWTKVGAFGGIIVPRKLGGKFVFVPDNKTDYRKVQPVNVIVSDGSPSSDSLCYKSMAGQDRLIVDEWLERIGIPFGSGSKEDEDVVYGVSNRHSERKIANLMYYEEFRKSLPEYPWSYRPPKGKRTLSLC